MNRHWIMIVFALMAASLLPAETPRPSDEAAIKSQLNGYAAARTKGDGHTQALFYSEDADEWGSGAREMSKGRAAIQKTLNYSPDPGFIFRLEPVNIGFLGADVALVDAHYGGATGDPVGHAFYVMVNRDGKWLIRSARITRFPPLPSAAK